MMGSSESSKFNLIRRLDGGTRLRLGEYQLRLLRAQLQLLLSEGFLHGLRFLKIRVQ
jgi:hypothetical protein